MNWKKVNLEDMQETLASVRPAGPNNWLVALDDGTTGMTSNGDAVARYNNPNYTAAQRCEKGYTLRDACIILGESTKKKK